MGLLLVILMVSGLLLFCKLHGEVGANETSHREMSGCRFALLMLVVERLQKKLRSVVPVRLIPIFQKPNHPSELMMGAARLIESSFCYDLVYPWQLLQSWALYVLASEQHKVMFSKSFCSSRPLKVIYDFFKSMLC